MALNTVTVTWNEDNPALAALSGTITFTLSALLTDATDGLVVHPVPKSYPLSQGSSKPLVANDNSLALPTGTFYTITVQLDNGDPYTFQAFINFANGATQTLASLVPIVTQPAMVSSLPLPSGTPVARNLPFATGVGEASAWRAIQAADLPATLLTLVASTGQAGYTMVNGTGSILTWTAPADGQLHRFALFMEMDCTVAATGGQITLQHTLPDGTIYSPQILAASQAAGGHNIGFSVYVMQAGSTVTLKQNSALTVGAAQIWAELWAL